jgi:hypothetical protein
MSDEIRRASAKVGWLDRMSYRFVPNEKPLDLDAWSYWRRRCNVPLSLRDIIGVTSPNIFQSLPHEEFSRQIERRDVRGDIC